MSFLDFLSKLGVTNTRTQADASTISKVGGTGEKQLTGDFIYPVDLFTPGNEPYMLFYVRDSVGRGAAIKQRMALYMPPTLRVNYSTKYEEISMSAIKWLKSLNAGVNAGNNGANQIAGGGGIWDAVKSNSGPITPVAIDVATGIWPSAGQQAQVFFETAPNPHMALLFNGPDFRSFTFNFQMMARNAKESDNIVRIIKSFKEAMLPMQHPENAAYWTYPDNFEIFLFSPAQQYLFAISTCVLENIAVDYAGSGIPSFTAPNGAPVAITMELTFKELEIMTREKVKKGY